jgi:hypothetical protein
VGPRAGLYRRLGGPQGRSVQEAGWAPGPVWTSAENLALIGIRSPNIPDRSGSLYRLRYTSPHFFQYVEQYFALNATTRPLWTSWSPLPVVAEV